jgi:hypothetical protein
MYVYQKFTFHGLDIATILANDSLRYSVFAQPKLHSEKKRGAKMLRQPPFVFRKDGRDSLLSRHIMERNSWTLAPNIRTAADSDGMVR